MDLCKMHGCCFEKSIYEDQFPCELPPCWYALTTCRIHITMIRVARNEARHVFSLIQMRLASGLEEHRPMQHILATLLFCQINFVLSEIIFIEHDIVFMSFTNRNNFSLCSSMPGFASNVLLPLPPPLPTPPSTLTWRIGTDYNR